MSRLRLLLATRLRNSAKARLQQLEEEITQVALQLRVEGIAPTQKRIAPYLSHPGILRNPQMLTHLRKICQEAEQNA